MTIFILLGQSYDAWISTAIRIFGVPGAFALALLYAFHRGWFHLDKEVIKMEKYYKLQFENQQKYYEKRIEELEESYKIQLTIITDQCKQNDITWRERFDELRRDSIDSLDRVRKEKDMWRDSAITGLNLAERVVTSVKTDPK